MPHLVVLGHICPFTVNTEGIGISDCPDHATFREQGATNQESNKLVFFSLDYGGHSWNVIFITIIRTMMPYKKICKTLPKDSTHYESLLRLYHSCIIG